MKEITVEDKWHHTLRRMHPFEKDFPRYGPEAIFSSSKAYCCLPTLYKQDRNVGYKGIFAGKMARPMWITKPLKSSPYQIIRGCIVDVGESAQDDFGKRATDFGNLWEPAAIDIFHRAYGGTLVRMGRIYCEKPEFSWIAATPDALWLSPEGKIFIIETKCLFSREFLSATPVTPADQRRPFDTSKHAEFVQMPKDGVPGDETRYPYIYVKEDAYFPAQYMPQFLIHLLSVGPHIAEGVLCVQLKIGTRDGVPPTLGVTRWDLDWDTAIPLLYYWQAVWDYVLKGREEVKRWEDKYFEMRNQKGEEHPETLLWKKSYDWKKDNCPWPIDHVKGGGANTKSRSMLPYIFDRYEKYLHLDVPANELYMCPKDTCPSPEEYKEEVEENGCENKMVFV